MRLNELLPRDDGCDLSNCPVVNCPGPCSEGESCVLIAPSCPNNCAKIQCDKPPSSASGSKRSTSPGALAGAVIGSILVLALIIFGYICYRRRLAAKEAAARERANVDVKPDIPARADAVLSRPDPHFAARASSLTSAEKSRAIDSTQNEAVRVYHNHSDATINLDPRQPVQSSAASTRSNPFTDKLSIQTASERSQLTNVIPIALVAPSNHDSQADDRPSHFRVPDASLNYPSSNGQHQLLGGDLNSRDIHPPYASSSRSGVSGRSYMTASSVDFDEAPQIMTPQQGVVRQVLGMSQAQVVRVPSNGSAFKTRGALTRHASKGTVGRSPLGQQAFTPTDIPLGRRELSSPTSTRTDPFTDTASPNNRESFADSSRTTDTFGNPSPYHSEGPFTPRPGATFPDAHARPVSVASTMDGVSIRADIGTASRVILGAQTVTSPRFDQSRATSMQTNSARSINQDDDFDGLRRPYSIVSAKTTSSRADSVLAAFPFVPPSPISALPRRSPGAGSPGISPISSGSTFAKQQALSTPLPNSPPLSPRSTATTQGSLKSRTTPDHQSLQATGGPSRSTSTFSSSTTSGLEPYPFQFGNEHDNPPPVPRNRASLDTLKIAQDLAAFPLELDNYPENGNRQR